MTLPRRLPWMSGIWPLLPPLAARGVHAVLLHGLRGIGKKSLALDFAEALLCASPQADRHGCGRCDECRLVASYSHPDLRWVLPQALAEQWLPQPEDETDEAEASAAPEADGEGRPARASREIRVEQIRALSDFLGIAAYRGGRRVVLLAPAEAMNAIAANTLLKMLEEPPPATFFLLVADALDDLLPTIRSRCVLVQVPPPAAEAALPWLAGQGVARPAEALALSSGAPLAALAEASQRADAAEAMASLYSMLEQGPALTLAKVAGAIGRDPAVGPALRALQCWAFDLLQYRARGSVRYHPQRIARIGQLAQRLSAEGLWRWMDTLKDAAAVREHPLNARLVIEMLLAGYIEVFDDRR
jgi:DNA polymerase-3 subunit delta'